MEEKVAKDFSSVVGCVIYMRWPTSCAFRGKSEVLVLLGPCCLDGEKEIVGLENSRLFFRVQILLIKTIISLFRISIGVGQRLEKIMGNLL